MDKVLRKYYKQRNTMLEENKKEHLNSYNACVEELLWNRLRLSGMAK